MNNKIESQLAIFGGKPIREHMLPYGKQFIDEKDIEAVVKTLKSDFVTCGPEVDLFEKKIAKAVNAQYAVTFSNGTAALHAACFAAGISEGDEVITTPMTFAASANCVLYCGGKPVFADIDEVTWNIKASNVERQITTKTKAIIPVDYTGMPVEIDKIMEIAQRHHLVVIQDAAHSLGACFDGQKIGSIADMTMFSFHPVKHITTGEGGVIVTNNEKYYHKLILFRSHGITRDISFLEDKSQSGWYYEQIELGYNYRMTDIQCALGSSQLNKLDEFVSRRKEIAMQYRQAFADLSEVTLQKIINECDSSWHLFVMRVNLERVSGTRSEIFEALRAENIGVNVHYIPVYLHPYYHHLGYEKGLCPNAETHYSEIISLPLFPLMSNQDVRDVIMAVEKVICYYKKR